MSAFDAMKSLGTKFSKPWLSSKEDGASEATARTEPSPNSLDSATEAGSSSWEEEENGICAGGDGGEESAASEGGAKEGYWKLDPCPSDVCEGVFALAPETTVPCHRGTTVPGNKTTGRLVNRWREVNGADLRVRGPRYLEKGAKQPSAAAAFRVVGLDVLHTRGADGKAERVYSVGGRPGGFVERYRKAAGASTPFLLIFNYILPWGNLIIYSAPGHGGASPYSGDAVLDGLLAPFLDGPTAATAAAATAIGDAVDGEAAVAVAAGAAADAARNRRLKMIPRCYDGPRVVRKVVTGKPAITGTKIEHRYSKGEGWMEVCFNLLSSKMTSSIFSLCNGLTQSVDIDIGFVLEGQSAVELPERVIAAIRFYRLETATGIRHMREWEQRP